jgi:glycolate oxidase FAD binding subunit
MAEIVEGPPQPESDASAPPRPDPPPTVSIRHLRAALATVVGAEEVFAEEHGQDYRLDRQAPALVARPGDPEEVAGCLAAADRLGAAVVPWGGGTAQALGYPPRAYDVALDLRRLNRVLAYEPGDLTISVEAGIAVEALDAVLAAHGQRVAVDCPQPRATTLGGLVATHRTGLRRLRYGTLRDLLIGIRAAHPDGTLTRGGGMVVKNVSGYDMMKLYLGSLGTLGVVVEVNLKLAPRPPSAASVLLLFSDLERALAAGEALLASQLVPSAVVALDAAVAAALGAEGAGAGLAVWFEGVEQAVAREVREVERWAPDWDATARMLDAQAAEALWARLAAFQSLDAEPLNAALLKLSVLPTDVAAAMASVAEIGTQVDLRCLQVADVGSGIVYVRVGQPEDGPEAVFAWALWALQTELVRRWGGSVVLSCPTVAKENLPIWGREPPGLPVMQALKTRFDPHAILNPGRFVGRI